MPSGGIEPDCLGPDGYVDPLVQLRKELHEEVGVEIGDFVPEPLAKLVEGDVTDLVFRVDLPLTSAEVEARFARLTAPEHSALAFIEVGHIRDELADHRRLLSASCRALLTMLADKEVRQS